MKMNKNVYMLMGLGAMNSNWNGDWSGMPKQDANGDFIASPYSLQYVIKEQLKNMGHKIMGLKSTKKDGCVRKITERYEEIMGEKEKSKKEYLYTLNKLLQCQDYRQFGCVYTGNSTIALRGTVQFNEGVNKYKDTNIFNETVLSPFSNSNTEEGSRMVTNGERFLLDEAHFIYSGSIFPRNYDEFINDEFEGYTEEDYKIFKDASLLAVSNYNSKAKVGCKNEFAMFIEANEEYNYLIDLANLNDYIEVYKENGKIIYDLTVLSSILNDLKDKIDKVEVYYNYRKIAIKGLEDLDIIKKHDLISRKEI